MKNLTIVTFTFSFLLISANIYAQLIAPLGLGNRWIFEGDISRLTDVDTNYVIDTISYHRFTIQNTNGFEYSRYTRLNDSGYYAVRFDTSYPAPNHELLYYKKNAVIGDSWINPGEDFPMVYTITDTIRMTKFGQTVTWKRLDIDASLLYFIEIWTEEFGILSRTQHPFPSAMYNLKGCVINGTVYGDTSFIVTVADDFESIKDFNLEQNYPNPFNPSTTIKFTIPTPPVSSPLTKGKTKEGFVTLKVYDVLGNEVATLINEEKPSGNYEVEFNAANLTSGTYFYQLSAGDFVETKKMILLR
jgi:hypothetical protein